MAIVDITVQHIVFILISLIGGMVAMYFWVQVYNETQKGSIAWLLLALTSVFLVSTALFSAMAVSPDPEIVELMVVFLGFWTAVCTSLFAAAGFMMYRAFKNVPRDSLGDFLIEGMIFNKAPVVKSACGTNCFLCEMYQSKSCMGCLIQNKYQDNQCPVYMCINEKEFNSCWDCDERDDCDKYAECIAVCPLKDEMAENLEVDKVSHLLTRSTLVEYTPHSRYEDSVVEICLRLYGEMLNVVLVSMEPRTGLYQESLGDLIDVGAVKFIELGTGGSVTESHGIINLPFGEIDKLFDLTSKLPKGCVVIFEPLSHLILSEGEDATYKFTSRMVEEFAARELLLVGLINQKAHDEKTVARFEGLFLNLAEEVGNRIRVTKGGKDEYIRFYVGEKFFMEQPDDMLSE